MSVIELHSPWGKNEPIWVNADQIIAFRAYEGKTIIYVLSGGPQGDGTINVLESPAVVAATIVKANSSATVAPSLVYARN